MTKIQFNDTYITVIPSYEQTREHSHSMLHVFFGKGTLKLNDTVGRMIILEQNVRHKRPEGEILFSAKLNKKLSGSDSELDQVGKNFFEIYEGMSAESSSTIRAMELGVPVYVEHQALKAKDHAPIYITSLSIPIMNANRIVGAIDLSTQENDAEEGGKSSEPIELKSSAVPVSGVDKLHATSSANFKLADIIAVDENMKRAKSYIPIVAGCDLPVLIYGETGTGKEVFAQAIHNVSARRNRPFIAQNCAAIPDTLLESLLFGTARGAFTDAIERKGLFELADGGTLFLDEINSMPLQLQAKLLRVLQDGTFRSLGSKEVKHVNIADAFDANGNFKK